MTWEYLESKEALERFIPIKEFLDFKDKVIVDLDCGSARFCKEIDFKFYHGNDIDKKYIDMANSYNLPNTKFEIKTDEEVANKIDFDIDVLMCLGFGAGNFTGEKLESQTLFESIFKIAEEKKPKHIIFEVIKPFEEQYKILDKLKERLKDYELTIESEITLNIDNKFIRDRVSCLLVRRPL